MKKGFHNILKLTITLTFLALLGACANTHKATHMKASLEKVRSTAEQALSAAHSAQDTASAAYTKAEAAEETANKALDRTAECCAKIDRMFEKAMRK